MVRRERCDSCATLGMSLHLSVFPPLICIMGIIPVQYVFSWLMLIIIISWWDAGPGGTGLSLPNGGRQGPGLMFALVAANEPVWPKSQGAGVIPPQLGSLKETAGEQGKGISTSQSHRLSV